MALLAVAAGCGSPTVAPTTTTPTASEPDYARAVTETTLKGLSDNNLEEYVKYANADFQAAVTREALEVTSKQITAQLGDYESITYLSTETQDDYTVVRYRAVYSKGEVGVKMVFDRDYKVAGQWFE